MKDSSKKVKFTFIDLFAGIGGFRFSLESFGGQCVFSSEWEKDAQNCYKENFGEMPSGDITKILEKDIPHHDILCGGFPCQAFSVSGKQLGFKDSRGTLFFDIARIAKEKMPKVVFLENVKNFAKHDNGRTFPVVKKILTDLGYNVYSNLLKSSDYGVPQARERFYIVAFRKDLRSESFVFPAKHKKAVLIKEILDSDVSDEFYISRQDVVLNKEKKPLDSRKPCQIGKIGQGRQGERIYSVEAAGITLSAHGGGIAAKTGAYLVDGKIRKLTPNECRKAQGFPDSFKLPSSNNIAYRLFGNSVSVPVISAIFSEIEKIIVKSK